MANEIKILYCADIHGDLKALEMLAASAEYFGPSLVVCNGDIVGNMLLDEEKKVLAEFKQYNAALREKSTKNESLESRTKEVLQLNDQRRGETYKAVKNILDNLSGELKCPCFVLSGEHDKLKQKGGILSDNLLDYRGRKLFEDRATIAGIPGGITISGQETDIKPNIYDGDNAFHMLMNADPDIAVVHIPPFKLFEDKEFAKIGSKALTSYINEQAPNLVLCAHTHRYGVRQWDSPSNRQTIVVNPGNLGAVYGSEGNTFAMITLDDLNYAGTVQILKQHSLSEDSCNLEVLAEFKA